MQRSNFNNKYANDEKLINDIGIFFCDNAYLDTSYSNDTNVKHFNLMKAMRQYLRECENLGSESITSENGIVV